MTFSFNGNDIREIVEIASIVGTVTTIVVFGFIAWLLVKPKRRRDAAPMRDDERIDMGEMIALMDRMERRLESLERSIEQAPRGREDRILQAAEGREEGRTQ